MLWIKSQRVFFAVVSSLTLCVGWRSSAAEPVIEFNRDIRPILSETCFQCHGPDAGTRKADLRLDQAASTRTVVQAGKPAASDLIKRILSDDPDAQMPPADARKQLSVEQKDMLVRWVQQGAQYPGHWSFEPLSAGDGPGSGESTWPRNQIDHYVLARLEKEGLQPADRAELGTLLRRMSLDLTGVSPALSDVSGVLENPSEAAIEQYVDRLLESSRYGEHMAMSWLEGARYADTDGYQNDRYRYHHVWRDWVIMAFNANKPYDRFVIEQLAGDMLPNATLTDQVATGFCRNHRINSEDGSIPAEWHVENVVDRVDTFGTLFLGLTISCARCHDHKYDPISQQDYYQLFAYFNNVPEWGVGPNNGNSPPFITIPKSWPRLTEEENRFVMPERVKLKKARVNEAGNGLRRPQAGSPQTLMIMAEQETPRETYLLKRGQYNQPDKSRRLLPDVPEAIAFQFGERPRDRRQLADWLVHPENPLTARVAVNRFWQQLFGVGLVKTSENFGVQGELPSHPQLLDYLARDFIASGWDVKALLKKMVLSATYQQQANVSAILLQRDPENRLLARGPRFRLSGFALRDQALTASGLLVDKVGGVSVKPYMPPKIWKAISNNTYKQGKGQDLYRRSLYTYWRRTIPPPTMMNFNAAAREVCIVRTDRTNTPLQALTMLNNPIFVESSRKLAERMLSEVSGSAGEQVRHGFRLLLTREPTAQELAILVQLYQETRSEFAAAPEAARKLLATGASPQHKNLAPVKLAAMAIVASTIMNLDEAVSKP
ncbi:MAG: PSD1 and planctomycete cytochrome C domain-containing protein [Planctomycetota bacterium]|nr:PSD1 and planctomycete cytochrome C domain-containing protein [Planctomycetota bacterium]